MELEGGCYCSAVRYAVAGMPVFKALCYCRACQHVAGGGPQYFMLVPELGFSITKGTPASFARSDLEAAVTRSFCRTCGTHLFTRRPGLDGVILKVGTLDEPGRFDAPRAAIFVAEKQPFHRIPDDLPQFAGLPPPAS
ncbi:GFA family protein [uncultured Roseobacter sp.]|uniref:GFA family protein n=1 Tax=uncultured Roseobacter sp. TaxID=114847 RepID=UPI0026214825|nr:GFA family protein [uncultured Roseobacter sp.]